MGFSRQEYWSGLSFPSPGIFLTQGLNPGLLHWQADSLPSEPPGKPFLLSYHTSDVYSSALFFPLQAKASVSQREVCGLATSKSLKGGRLRFLCSTPDLQNESPAQELAFLKDPQVTLMHMKSWEPKSKEWQAVMDTGQCLWAMFHWYNGSWKCLQNSKGFESLPQRPQGQEGAMKYWEIFLLEGKSIDG